MALHTCGEDFTGKYKTCPVRPSARTREVYQSGAPPTLRPRPDPTLSTGPFERASSRSLTNNDSVTLGEAVIYYVSCACTVVCVCMSCSLSPPSHAVKKSLQTLNLGVRGGFYNACTSLKEPVMQNICRHTDLQFSIWHKGGLQLMLPSASPDGLRRSPLPKTRILGAPFLRSQCAQKAVPESGKSVSVLR